MNGFCFERLPLLLGIAGLVALPCAALRIDRFDSEARVGTQLPAAARTAQVYFSPRGGCTDAIVAQIDGAQEAVLVQAYSFTSTPIAQALIRAHRRGVDVQVILDKSRATEDGGVGRMLLDHGIAPLIDSKHKIAHNKTVVIDEEVVITGSMNFSKVGEERNAENVLVLHDAPLAATYTDNWEEHADHSDPYLPPGAERVR